MPPEHGPGRRVRPGGRPRRAVLAGSILAIGILGLGTAAWLAGSRVSTWRELYAWYNPAIGFQSAALPVGFEDLVDRIKDRIEPIVRQSLD